ncbi:hypothetical protein BOO33_02330 [Vibrio navarrensis]|nr:hypothetical protein [Vibrio navarrensis]
MFLLMILLTLLLLDLKFDNRENLYSHELIDVEFFRIIIRGVQLAVARVIFLFSDNLRFISRCRFDLFKTTNAIESFKYMHVKENSCISKA